MAARESQGLQIALIIFGLLTVALGISTYLFFDKFQQETLKISSLQEEALKAKANQEIAEKDLRDLKRLVTDTPSEKVAALVSTHEELHKTLNPQSADETAVIYTYPELIEQLEVTKRQLAGDLDSSRSQVLTHEKRIQDIELGLNGQIAVYKKKSEDAAQRLAGIENNYSLAATQFTQKTDAALAAVEVQKRNLGTRETEVAKSIEQRDQVIRGKEKREKDLLTAIDKLRPDPEQVKTAAGRVSLVRTENKTAYINLGSADGLRPRVRFLVIANNNQAIGEATPKATLEVTQVLEGHRSIARILDSELLDPVLPNDRIYSETWKKGQRTGFALAGWMDMDGDGRSDRRKIVAIIARNSGRIDAQVEDDGRITGKMTPETDYLLTGDYPREPRGNKASQKGYERFIATADKNNSRKMSFRTYLQNLGYTVTDSKGKKVDFRSRKPAGKKGAYKK
jgi:hypothetical protein